MSGEILAEVFEREFLKENKKNIPRADKLLSEFLNEKSLKRISKETQILFLHGSHKKLQEKFTDEFHHVSLENLWSSHRRNFWRNRWNTSTGTSRGNCEEILAVFLWKFREESFEKSQNRISAGITWRNPWRSTIRNSCRKFMEKSLEKLREYFRRNLNIYSRRKHVVEFLEKILGIYSGNFWKNPRNNAWKWSLEKSL